MKTLKIKIGCEFIAENGYRYKVVSAYSNGGGRAWNLTTDEFSDFTEEDTKYFNFIQ